MILSIVWGFSTSLPWAIAARALSGAGNGNVGIIRTMVAEMVPEKVLQPRAFSVMPLVWSIGSVLGPAFGGFFASPAVNLPGLFANSKLFTAFPFLLPNLIAAVFFAIGILVGFLFMKETLETRQHIPDYGLALGQKIIQCFKPLKGLRHSPDYDDDELRAALLHHSHSRNNSLDSNRPFDPSSYKPAHPVHAPPSVWEVFNTQSTLNLLSYTFLALHSMAFDQLLPIFMHHPRPTSSAVSFFKFTGGFGISSSRIGTLFTLYGITAGIVQFFVFPVVVNRFGVLASYRVCAVIIPAVMFVTPYTALIRDETTQQATMLAIMAVKACVGIFMFPCSMICLTNSAGSMRLLGTLNGVATTMSAVGRAAGPFLAGTVFTWGLERGYVIVAWWMLGVLAIIGAIPIFCLVEMDGFNKVSDSDDDEDGSDEDELVYVEDDAGTIIDGDEFLTESDAEEAINTVDDPPLDRQHRLGVASVRRRMSSPIGVRGSSIGPGERGRRLSTNLGYSNFGRGTGGTTFG
jgi:MFS family permease